jgi:DNA-directed RNA polymerase subunit M/transcription elongation factor TFIIS
MIKCPKCSSRLNYQSQTVKYPGFGLSYKCSKCKNVYKRSDGELTNIKDIEKFREKIFGLLNNEKENHNKKCPNCSTKLDYLGEIASFKFGLVWLCHGCKTRFRQPR